MKFGKYFCGNEISEYGRKHGFVDYGTLAKAFNAVLNNNIIGIELGYWEQTSGFVNNQEQIEELEEQVERLEEQVEALEENGLEEHIDEVQEQIEELKEQIEELENEMKYTPDIFQYYIVDDAGARILEEYNEIVFYNDELDIYLWGVTHYGTAWNYVLTNIPCAKEND